MNDNKEFTQSDIINQKNTRQNGKKKWLFLLLMLLLITFSCMCVTLWVLLFKDADIVLTPDYAPQEIEVNQTPIGGDDSSKMETEDGGGAASLLYSSYVTIDLSEKQAVLMVANSGKSMQDMVVQIVIQDQIVAQSGRLTSGNKVTILNLLNGAEKKLTVGGYDAEFVVLYYDPDTGEKSIVNTEIPISVSVIE